MLSECDFVEMVRLIGQLGDPQEDDLTRRRQKLAQELVQLLGAEAYSWSGGRLMAGRTGTAMPTWKIEGHQENNAALMDRNVLSNSQRRRIPLIPSDDLPQPDPSIPSPAIGQLLKRDHGQSHSGIQIFDTDEIVYSLRLSGENGYSCLGLSRRRKGKSFGERERFLLHVVFQNIEWIHDPDWKPEGNDTSWRLTYRQREVLLQLLQGKSRKAIAESLRLSEYTIVEYMSQIYRRFQIRNRNELLSSFVGREQFKPLEKDSL